MYSVRLLFLGGGPMMPTKQPIEMMKYKYFSKYFSGDIITCIRSYKHFVIKSIGRFGYHPFVVRGNTVLKNLKSIRIYIKKTIELNRTNKKYDVIITSNPLLTGMIALFLGRIIGAKVIIEVNGNFESAFKYGRKGETTHLRFELIKGLFSRVAIPFVLKKADMVKLLSDNQLEPFCLNKKNLRIKVFSDFVPVNKFIEYPRNDGKYILLVGYPWYLKGVDLLIKAFNMICHEYPNYRLKIVGWCPTGRDYYEKLAKDNPKIELCDPVHYHDIIPIMANCSIYVLASRTEAMGRVLIEAMACRKPIIASNVGGVYSIIKHRHNGLHFKKENISDLASKIRYLLSNPNEAERLADNGFEYVQKFLSEDCYMSKYKEMIYQALEIGKTQPI